ncbi:MAG: PrsW family glutamic-type intramembrane protease [Candidatus Paceibacterota bacterium]
MYSFPTLFLYLILAVLPSIVWLLFFLREDANPEPNWIILKVYLYGALAVAPIFILETGFRKLVLGFNLPPILIPVVGAAVIEETTKLVLVRQTSLSSPALDEPTDVMLYLIIAGLGFAALENIFLFMKPSTLEQFSSIYLLSGMRLIGATFLHALAAGLSGFFLALSFTEMQNKLFVPLGLILAIALHSAFNYSIIKGGGGYSLFSPLLLLTTGILVLFAFKKLRSMKSVCRFRE